ncbi:MAG: DsbE family thiol:disulfide interchange protein [Xanthomonadales bacterium]|nr:DsbE family thiol:disulfide interchange protein [Gammaproteobacteria bacterium]NNE05776.1 DsbE family thiol:disulfide interchange protein [Xanthomonadales bacterium]NNL96295.1 DsbE family thiol:disulfide interchange protein [Xanthomonadales bacterium]
MGRLLPLIAFLLLGVLLAVGLTISDTKTHIPSPLIGRTVPSFDLPVLYEPGSRVSNEDLLGEPYLVNFFGSWCPTCVFEHPVLEDLADSGQLKIVGLNYRDEPEDARNWLARHGDPYDIIITDYDGQIGIDFGVYAAPESFLVDDEGIIIYKHIGALTPEVVEGTLLPLARGSGS